MNLRQLIWKLVVLLICLSESLSFNILVKQIATDPNDIPDLSDSLRDTNKVTSTNVYDLYFAQVIQIVEMASLLISKIASRKSGKTAFTMTSNTNCNNWGEVSSDFNLNFNVDLVVYVTIFTQQYDYNQIFGLADTNQEIMHGFPCSLSSDTGFDLNRPVSGVLIFKMANIFGPDFVNPNGKVLYFDSYVKLAAKSILNIMGLNIDVSQYWLDSTGNVYPINPVRILSQTTDGKNHYAIYSPSILQYAKTYFQPANDPTFLILGTYTSEYFKHITISMHLAPEDLLSEINQLSFFYLISGFTLAAINDMGWYSVDYSYQQSLTFASSVSANFLQDVNSLSTTLNTKYPQQFSITSPSLQCYFAYGKKELIISRSILFIPTGILLYKELCQSSDGYFAQLYNVYSPSSACFISNLPNQINQQVCFQQSCLSSGSMIQVQVNQALTNCNSVNSIITGIQAITVQTTTYSLTCPSEFNIQCTSEKPCLNNCTQNGVCLSQTCQCLDGYIGQYCQKQCLSAQWYDAVLDKCVDQCPTGYYGNVQKNRECTLCPTSNCLDDCPIGYYRKLNQVTCIKCPIQCKECISDTYCNSCQYAYVKVNNFCKCEIGYFDVASQKCISCTSAQYYDITLGQCTPCDINCLTCQDTSTFCTSCKPTQVLDVSTCVNNCPNGKFNSNGFCKSCAYPCKTCQTSNTQCITCADTFTSQGTLCVCVNSYYDIVTQQCKGCVQGQVFDSVNNLCVNCDPICLTCKDKDNTSFCTSCQLPKKLNDTTCVDNCPSTKYLDTVDNTCKLCDINCQTCQLTSTNCLSCNEPHLQLQGSVCICVAGYYNAGNCVTCAQNQIIDIPGKQCYNCNPTCKTCKDKFNLNYCLSCQNPLVLESGQCQNTCFSGRYADGSGVCQNCDSTCSQCQTLSTTCTACKDTFTLQVGKCVCVGSYYDTTTQTCKTCAINQIIDIPNAQCLTCDTSCRTCLDKDHLNACTSCTLPKVLDGSNCVDVCPPQKYKDAQNVCQLCDKNCYGCIDNSTKCTSCNNPLVISGTTCICLTGYYDSNSGSCINCALNQVPDTNQCLTCNPNCQTCLDKNNLDNCTSCINPNSLDGTKCVNPCPSGKYADSGVCKQCNTNCLQCITNSANCTFCKNTFTLQNNKCVCVNSYYDATTNSCISCSLNEILDIPNSRCIPCNTTCRTCLDQNNLNTCTSCNPPAVLNAFNCISQCPDNKYQDAGNVCRVCDPICLKCQNTSTQCTACNNPLIIQGTTCICQSGYYNPNNALCVTCLINQVPDNIKQQCVDCNPTCKTCQDKDNVNTCTSCQKPQVLDNGTCITACPIGKYEDANGVCQVCNTNCVECATTSTNCTKCLATQQQLNGVCICNLGYFDTVTKTCKTCASNEVLDIPLKKCWPCDTSCLTCQDKTNLDKCLSCVQPKFLSNFKCVDKCQDGKFQDNNNICQNCDNNCLTCQQSSINCLSCSSPLALKDTKCMCTDGLFFKDNICYESCPSGTARNYVTMTCDKCHISCLTCRTTDISSCINCQIGFEKDSNGLCVLICGASMFPDPVNMLKCLPCSPNCTSCTLSPLNCSGCVPPLVLMNTSCIPSCPPLFEAHFGICIPIGSCDKNCIKCDVSGNCLQCLTGYFIQGKLCVQQCGTGYYFVSVAGICQECYKNCAKCTGPNQMDCQTYIPPQPITQPNYSCHQSCTTCSGPNYDECITCNQNRELVNYFNKSIGTCQCQEGFTDYFLSPCSRQPETSLIKDMAISSTVLNTIVTMMSSSPVVLLFLIDAQQTLSYFRYLNINKPLNFDKQISPLYYSHIHPFFPNVAKDWLPPTKTQNTSTSLNQNQARNLQQTNSITQNDLDNSDSYHLREGNNKINENQKYPYFIVNAFVIIVFQVVLWVVGYMVSLVLKYKELKRVGLRIANIFRYNAIIVLLYITISELSLLTFFQFTMMSWETNLEVVSSILAIVCLLYIIGISFLLYNNTITQRQKNIQQQSFYILFGLFKDKHSINKYYPFILFMRKIITSLIYAFLYDSSQAQGILMVLVYLPFWAYMLKRNPFENIYAKITSVITESLMLFCHMFFLALSVSEQNKDIIGMTDILLIFITITLTTYTVLAAIGIVGYAYIKIKEYRQRHTSLAKIYPSGSNGNVKKEKISDSQSKSNKDDDDDDQLSALSLQNQNITQTPLKTQDNIQNTLNNSNIINQSASIYHNQTAQNTSMAYLNSKMNNSQNLNNQHTRQFDIIDETSHDEDLPSDQRYQTQSYTQQKSLTQENCDQLEFSFRSRLEGIKEQDNEDGSVQFSVADSHSKNDQYLN